MNADTTLKLTYQYPDRAQFSVEYTSYSAAIHDWDIIKLLRNLAWAKLEQFTVGEGVKLLKRVG